MNIETTDEPIREGLPSLPKGKMLSGMDMESLHVLYTAGQMQDYARAALAACAAAPEQAKPTEARELTDADIDTIWQAMPGGPAGWLNSFGYQQFAREVEGAVLDTLEAAPQPPATVQGESIGDDAELSKLIVQWYTALNYYMDESNLRVKVTWEEIIAHIDARTSASARDAERYRFIRDNVWADFDNLQTTITLQRNSRWDSDIDAAIATTKATS